MRWRGAATITRGNQWVVWRRRSGNGLFRSDRLEIFMYSPALPANGCYCSCGDLNGMEVLRWMGATSSSWRTSSHDRRHQSDCDACAWALLWSALVPWLFSQSSSCARACDASPGHGFGPCNWTHGRDILSKHKIRHCTESFAVVAYLARSGTGLAVVKEAINTSATAQHMNTWK